jgi:hypothetical protein
MRRFGTAFRFKRAVQNSSLGSDKTWALDIEETRLF